MKKSLLLLGACAFVAVSALGQSQLKLNSTKKGEITGIPNVSNFFEIDLEAGTAYQIEMKGTNLDCYLELYQGNQQLATNDDGGDGLNARLVFEPTETGTYIVNATRSYGLEGESLGQWELIVTEMDCLDLTKGATADLWIREDEDFNQSANNVCVKFPTDGTGHLVVRSLESGSKVTLWMEPLSSPDAEPYVLPLSSEMSELSLKLKEGRSSWILYLMDSETWYRQDPFPVWKVSGQ